MQATALNTFIKSIGKNWNGLTTPTVLRCRELLQQLAQTSAAEPWLAQIHAQRPETVELYTDPIQGFKLLAHTEPKNLYRLPHDHGSGWVLYAVHYGELKMSTFKQITDCHGKTHLVSRGCEILRPGDCNVFLPGDIHDTQCVSDYLLQFRFTSSDFKLEKKAGRMIQFEDQRFEV